MDIRSRNFPQIKSKIFLGLLRQMRLAVLLFVSAEVTGGTADTGEIWLEAKAMLTPGPDLAWLGPN